MEIFIILALESGAEFNNEFCEEASEKKNYVFAALTRIHARACQISSEVLVLLKSGYADGAHARWRSLHELAVIASYINASGNEVAEKYLLYENIETWRFAKSYNEHCEFLGYPSIPPVEIGAIADTCDKLLLRFGDSYKSDYGWAIPTMSNKKRFFADIEKEVGLDHLRPFYKLACHNVHAGPKSLSFRLGLLGDKNDTLLAGPSNYGFADPAQNTAISLRHITAELLTTKPTIGNLVLCNILAKLQGDIGKEFLKVQQEIEENNG